MDRPATPRRTQMMAAIVTEPGKIAVQAHPLPEPGRGQVRVRLEGCGVCASNLGPWAGPNWMTFPTEPGGLGHEGWVMSMPSGRASETLRWAIAWQRCLIMPMPPMT